MPNESDLPSMDMPGPSFQSNTSNIDMPGPSVQSTSAIDIEENIDSVRFFIIRVQL